VPTTLRMPGGGRDGEEHKWSRQTG
jgi:hypothetical protein